MISANQETIWGMSVIMPQATGLPMANRREDILIKRP
jgi:hypothetical protein